MATPTELFTTVSGKRCSRSRARTLAASSSFASSLPPAQTIEDSSLGTTTDAQIETTTTTAAAAVTTRVAVVSSAAQPSAASSTTVPPAAAAASSVTVQPFDPSPPTAVITNDAGASEDSATSAPSEAPPETTTAALSMPTSTDDTPVPEITSTTFSISNTVPQTLATLSSSSNRISSNVPQQTNSPSGGGSAGMISPERGSNGTENTPLVSENEPKNVGSIVGGVMGGFVGIALVSALLFICIRRRGHKRMFMSRRQRTSEKEYSSSASARDKLKTFVAGMSRKVGGFFAKFKSNETVQNPSRRHSTRSSISSVYSSRTNQRGRSMSEPQWRFRERLRGLGDRFGDRMPSLKRSKTLLGKKQDSLVGAKSPFPRFVEDPLMRSSKTEDNDPFADPATPNATPNGPPTGGNKSTWEGLQDQQRAPITPRKPEPTAGDRNSGDPFASILDELDSLNGSGTPPWLAEKSHKRTQSYTTALRSHPPSSFYPESSFEVPMSDPFADPGVPPMPARPLPTNPPPLKPGSSLVPGGYAGGSSSTGNGRESSASFFGEPGPSRPTTMFSVAMAPQKVGRQSDPFDLDRPEVLGYGNVTGRKEVRASVTRQNSRSNRVSSVPNVQNLDDWLDRRTAGKK